MQFASLQEFLAMGGHAPYVWTAYGVTLAVMLYILCAPLLAQRRFVREERQRMLREAAPGRAPTADAMAAGGQAEQRQGATAPAEREASS
jgi:heme exporter protein D